MMYGKDRQPLSFDGGKRKGWTGEMGNDVFGQAVSALSENIIQKLERIPDAIRMRATEIKLRTGLPLMIMTTGDPVFVLKNGDITYHNREGVYLVGEDDVQKSFRKICGYSVHSYQNEIKNGFLTIDGNRVGFCGTAVTEDQTITAVRKITSINVRIARQIIGAADELVSLVTEKDSRGVLIAGAPSTGKTTILKDLARQLANGSTGKFWQLSVVDERGELGGERGSACRNDLGISCDVFTGYPKGKGMEIAVRTMAPEILVCDEIGNREDAEAIRYAANSGVRMVATIHARDRDELLKKPFFPSLLRTGAFTSFVFLENGTAKGKVRYILSREMLTKPLPEKGEKTDAENTGSPAGDCGFIINRGRSVIEFIKESPSAGTVGSVDGADADLSPVRADPDRGDAEQAFAK